MIAFADRTTADEGRTGRVLRILVTATVLVAVLLAVGGVLLGVVGTGLVWAAASLLLGGGGTLGAQRIVHRRAARRAASARVAQANVTAAGDPATDQFPAPGAGPLYP